MWFLSSNENGQNVQQRRGRRRDRASELGHGQVLLRDEPKAPPARLALDLGRLVVVLGGLHRAEPLDRGRILTQSECVRLVQCTTSTTTPTNVG
jgi:hypothetical protein